MLESLQPIRNLRRWREVQSVLFRYGFDFLINQKEVRRIQTAINEKLNLSIHLPQSELIKLSLPQRVRLMLQELGPTYVKLGQILSSRSDLLPRDWIEELTKLQDEVPPFPYEDVQEIIEEELGPIEELFLDFDPEPVAAASIGQVHYALLPDFKPVVVKVQRPNITNQIRSDLEFVKEVARLVRSQTDWGKKYGVMALVEEMTRVLNEELDYRYEATNADRLRRNMASEPDVKVPFMYWDLITPRVLTMERIDGVKINDLKSLDRLGIDRVKLANVFIRSLFKQLLIDGFFHADPHPANLFVDKKTHALVYIDMGMMGSLLAEQREQLGDILTGIMQRDTQEILRLGLQLGTPFQPINEIKLRREIDRIIHQYLEAPLDRFSIANLISQVLTTIFQNGIRLPAELGWAAKTFLQGEDVGRTLNPKIPIIEIFKKISLQVFLQRLNPQPAILKTATSFRELGTLLKLLPRVTTSILKQLDAGEFRIAIDIVDLREVIAQILIIANRIIAGLVLVGMVVGSAIAMGVPAAQSWPIIPILGTVGFILSIVLGVFLYLNVYSEISRKRHQLKKEIDKKIEK